MTCPLRRALAQLATIRLTTVIRATDKINPTTATTQQLKQRDLVFHRANADRKELDYCFTSKDTSQRIFGVRISLTVRGSPGLIPGLPLFSVRDTN